MNRGLGSGSLNLSGLEGKWDKGTQRVPLNHAKTPAGHRAGLIKKERNLSCINMAGGYKGRKRTRIIRLGTAGSG